MIASCRRCHRPYWKYWSSALPSDKFCSVHCYEDRYALGLEGPPAMPQEIARQIRQHMLLRHSEVKLNRFPYDDCFECERLQELHADSVYYYCERVMEVAL